MVNRTRALQPVYKINLKHNNSKEPNVPTKTMRRSRVPARGPTWCLMVRKLRKHGCDITLPVEWRCGGNTDVVFYVRMRLGGTGYLRVLDIEATISFVAPGI